MQRIIKYADYERMASKDATNETNCNAQQESPAILFVKFDNNSELQKKNSFNSCNSWSKEKTIIKECNELLSMQIMNEWHLKMQRMKQIATRSKNRRRFYL